MSTISRPSPKTRAFIDSWQVDIVDLTASYVRNLGIKSATILDGAEPCRVEEFAERHFRRLGFEATFVESQPFAVLFGVFFWSIIQDHRDPRARTVGICNPYAYDREKSTELIWIRLPSDFGSADYSLRRGEVITEHLCAIPETRAELLRLFDSWLAPSVNLRHDLSGYRREAVETARKLIELIPPLVLKTVLGYLILNYWEHRSGWPDLLASDLWQEDLMLFRNFYRRARCSNEWMDVWSAACDDNCPFCGARHMSPYKREDVEEDEGDDA